MVDRLLHPALQPAEQSHTHARAQPLSVDTGAIQDGAVTSIKIADGTITSADLASSLYGTVGSVTSIDPDDTASAGVSTAFAPIDHQHAENLLPAGVIWLYGGTAAPTGWLLCDGASLLRSSFADLFTAIGTAYGAADGTHFNVPDLRQRFPLGKATSGTGATLGGTGGTIDHVHALDTSSSFAKIAMNDTTDQISSEVKATSNWTRNAGASLVTNNTAATDALGAKLAGSSDVANPPFQTFNFIIKT